MGNRVNKNKAEQMRMIFSKCDTAAKACVLVTDSLGDMREGASVGVGSIGVSWGFQDRATLQKAHHFASLRAHAIFPALLRTISPLKRDAQTKS